MTRSCLPFFDVRTAASAVSYAAHARFVSDADEAREFHERCLRESFDGLLKAYAALNDTDEGATYLVVDTEGTFRETERGMTRQSVIKDIAIGEYEVEQVLRLAGPICQDVTAAIADEVFDAVRHQRFGNSTFIPAFLADRLPEATEELRLSWMTPDEIRAERDEENADRAYEAMRDRQMEDAA